MGTTVSIILFIIAIILHKRRGTWVAPDVFFCYEWAIITFMASLCLFGLYEASDLAWTIILVGCLSFVFGTYIVIPQKSKLKVTKITEDEFFDERTFWIIVIFTCIFSFLELYQSIGFLEQGYSIGDVREARYGGDTVSGIEHSNSGINWIINMVSPVLKLIIFAAGVQFYILKKERRYLYAVAIIALMQAFTDGGRVIVLYFILDIIVCAILYGKEKELIKVWKRPEAILVIIIGLSAVVLLSIMRGVEEEGFVEKGYRYLCGNVVFFDLHLDKFNGNLPLFYVYNSFQGLWFILFPLLHIFLGIEQPPLAIMAVNYINDTQDRLYIGMDKMTNAFITPFYHLYADGRMAGVIIGMVLLGILAGYVYKMVKKNPTGRNVVFYLLIFQMVFKTFHYYPFVYQGYVLAVLLFLLYRRPHMWFFKKKSKVNKYKIKTV